MNLKVTGILLVFFVSVYTASACLNNYHVNEKGIASRGKLDGFEFELYQFSKEYLLKEYKVTTDTLKKKWSYDYYSDYGVVLIKAGYFEQGLNIFRYLNKNKPGEYNIVANLATAYELNGYIDSALYWIREALKLNQDSHGKSEWIHLAILQAKVQEAKQPGWLKTHPIFSPEQLANNRDREIANHFRHQLFERIPFTPAPDLIMSKVLEELGDHIIRHHSVSEAWKLYAVADVYAKEHTTQLANKIKRARVLTETYRTKPPKNTSVRHWPTAQSVTELIADYKGHTVMKMENIQPILYH